ncbi:hypothetical protein JIG36_02080 [Actinoplanes sp. LDG1-06]|uniref:Uncharacterized protein n=1 Tax=Paractinoplanes ovalisporus TaxID=2810368 RepID=A0ABS2A4X8_9ACTN|nr:hypothetical protein [Actinoplanes ovalisporus]MBM2614344.1 hypothetical protein [Actinoplanes ovalisporus]
MDEITLTVASALIGAMAEDSWQQAKSAVTGLWRRFRPDQAETVEAELVSDRERVLVARARHDTAVEQHVRAGWQARLASLSDGDAVAAQMLHELAQNRWVIDQKQIRTVTQNAQAFGSGRVYQSAGDMTINER